MLLLASCCGVVVGGAVGVLPLLLLLLLLLIPLHLPLLLPLFLLHLDLQVAAAGRCWRSTQSSAYTSLFYLLPWLTSLSVACSLRSSSCLIVVVVVVIVVVAVVVVVIVAAVVVVVVVVVAVVVVAVVVVGMKRRLRFTLLVSVSRMPVLSSCLWLCVRCHTCSLHLALTSTSYSICMFHSTMLIDKWVRFI